MHGHKSSPFYAAVCLTYSFELDMDRLHPDAKLLGTMMLPGFRLVFRAQPEHYALASMEEHKGSSVPVALWRIPRKYEKALDRACPAIYHKIILEVSYQEKTYPCFTYVMSKDYPIRIPRTDYFQLLLDKYLVMGFGIDPLCEAYQLSFESVYGALQEDI